MTGADAQKRDAAEAAAALVQDGMIVGLGTGSTAQFAIAALIRRARSGLRIKCIATSDASEAQAIAGGLVITDFAAHPRIDLTIDGADQIARDSLFLVKGLGGALLHEKLVAASSDRLVIIADESKLVDGLGNRTPVPVEVVTFAWEATSARLARVGCTPVRRCRPDGAAFVTDGGNFILDCHFDTIADAAALERDLSQIVGVIETGLFIGMASMVLVGTANGVMHLP